MLSAQKADQLWMHQLYWVDTAASNKLTAASAPNFHVKTFHYSAEGQQMILCQLTSLQEPLQIAFM